MNIRNPATLHYRRTLAAKVMDVLLDDTVQEVALAAMLGIILGISIVIHM